ncbi:hypothetical protein DV735_g5175, partial [Chaetothyriales sp. CBS 134920]
MSAASPLPPPSTDRLVPEEIKANLRSADTTTSLTLNLVRALLGTVDGASASDGLSKGISTSGKTKKPVAPKRPATRKTAFRIHDANPPTRGPLLPDSDRRRAAAEIINTTLKTISATAKTRQAVVQPTKELVQTSSSTSPRKTIQPLQEQAPNRLSKPERTVSSKDRGDIECLVQCAEAALECLRQPVGKQSAPSFDLGIENAALAIVDKCLLFHLKGHAESQLRKIHDQYWKRRKQAQPVSEAASLFRCLLMFEEDDIKLFKFATSLQSQCLRLLILADTQTITQECIKALQPDTPGSPAQILGAGKQRGHISADSCASQMRTVALAVSKLYARAAEAPRAWSTNSQVLLSLSLTALHLKALSWGSLGPNPDLQQELWTPLGRSIKQYLTHTRESKANYIAHYVQGLWATLQLQGLHTTIPADALKLLQRVSPSIQLPKGQSISPVCRTNPDANDTTTILLQRLRQAVDALSTEATAPEQCLASMESALSILRQPTYPEKKHLTEFLVQSAHLRKAAIARISSSLSSDSPESGIEVCGELQRQAARIIYALLNFFCTNLDALNPGTENTILLTLAKTVESVTSLERYSFVKSDDMVAQSRASLLKCLHLCESIHINPETHKDSSIYSFFQSLPLRLSQCFWSRYRYFTEKRWPLEVRLEALHDSTDILQRLTQESQKSGHIVVNYEELCRIFVEQEDYAKAKQSLSSAIKHQILQGYLTRAAEHALHNTQGQVWDDSDLSVHSLGRNLAKYAELSFAGKGGVSMYFDQEDLPCMQRAVLVGRQVTAALAAPMPLLSSQQLRSGVRSVLDHSVQPTHCPYRLRFISHILRLLERSNAFAPEEVFDGETFVLPPIQASKRHPPLASSLISITVRTQWMFACRRMEEIALERFAAEFSHALDAQGSQWQSTPDAPDLGICMGQLRALSDFAEMLGRTDMQLSVLDSLWKLHSVDKSADPAQRAIDLSQRALLLTREGETVQADKLFVVTSQLTKDTRVTEYAACTLLLDHAEYLLDIGNFPECLNHLSLADAELAKGEWQSSRKGWPSKLEKESIRCRRALISSRLAFCRGLLTDAFVNARQAARLSTTLWTAIERATGKSEHHNDTVSDSSMDVLADEMSAISLQGRQRPKQNSCWTVYWTQISLHRAALIQVGAVAAHCGLYLDAVFYYRQAAQTADHTAGRAYKTRVESQLALTYAGAQDDTMAKSALANIMPSLSEAVLSVDQCHLILNLSEALWLLGDEEHAREWFERALVFSRKHKPGAIVSELPHSTVAPARKVVKRKAPSRQLSSRTKQTTQEQPKVVTKNTTVPSITQKLLRARLEALQCSIFPCMGEAASIGREIAKAPNVAVAKALQLLEQATAFFASDPTHSSLAETALALPVRSRPGRKSGQLSLLLEEDEGTCSTKAEPSQKSSKTATHPPESQGCRLLTEAYACIKDLRGQELGELPSYLVHAMHKTMSKLHLLSTTLAQPLTHSPLPVVMQSLVSKDIARSREQIAIAAEARVSRAETTGPDLLGDFGDFVNALPSTWRVVSIGISYDRHELMLSKISAGVSPFLIRVPLARPGFDDLEAHDFTLESAHDQLADIIARADANTHDPRGQGDKATRKEWYAEREGLDQEMGCLLKNMEDLWLGGFKGLLSDCTTESSLLARFGQSLNQALDKHLPSRQKTHKREAVKLELHARVLELFVSLKLEDTAEFEDAITDLLYFVVDTLNFNGEPNAVDEIDFDGLLVDVLDALKAYHHAAAASSEGQAVHTILILDKELHSFPWESLPCLRGQAVYRMPSLGAVKERLDKLRQQSAESAAITVRRRSGAYILNPSGDLTSTQDSYAGTLEQQLPGFAAIVNRAPTEEEFKANLSDRDVLLYFGHGSGGQYIRGRTIRGLKTGGKSCAVTWLMGCSSVKMTTCGIYEPYGTPWHYINGGAHAVVGTLWDVTDREIDRFAMKALTDWGLLEETEETKKVTEGGRGKGKRRGGQRASPKPKTTSRARAIGEAVAVARETCFLKYLSGASPVVYGIPVCVE